MAILAVESPDAQRRETLPLNFDASSETLDLDRDRILEASIAVEATRRRELAPGGTRVPLPTEHRTQAESALQVSGMTCAACAGLIEQALLPINH